MNCSTCQYFKDLTFFNMGFKCFNKENSPKCGDFLEIEISYICDKYIQYSDNLFEWDENKNKSNIKKHDISFEKIHELFADQNLIQMVEDKSKWEDLSNLDASIQKNEGNLDPIRAKLVGKINEKIYTAIYTFRDELAKMRYRIISLRRAHEDEIKFYNSRKL